MLVAVQSTDDHQKKERKKYSTRQQFNIILYIIIFLHNNVHRTILGPNNNIAQQLTNVLNEHQKNLERKENKMLYIFDMKMVYRKSQ